MEKIPTEIGTNTYESLYIDFVNQLTFPEDFMVTPLFQHEFYVSDIDDVGLNASKIRKQAKEIVLGNEIKSFKDLRKTLKELVREIKQTPNRNYEDVLLLIAEQPKDNKLLLDMDLKHQFIKEFHRTQISNPLQEILLDFLNNSNSKDLNFIRTLDEMFDYTLYVGNDGKEDKNLIHIQLIWS